MRPFHCLVLSAVYFSQFLPLAFCFMALPTILISRDVPLEQVSLIYALVVVWMLKLFWAPFVDKIKFGRWGHYKAWLLASQLLLIVATVVLAFKGSVENFHSTLVLGFTISLFASFQDIAADAIACRLIPANKRGLGSAIQLSGGLCAMIIGSGAVLILFEHFGWQTCLLAVSFLVILCSVPILYFKEEDIELDDSAVVNRPSFSRLLSFWKQPGMYGWAAILVALPLGITMAMALTSPLLIGEGWTAGEVGVLLHIVAPLCGVAVASVFGYCLNKYDKWLVLSVVPILQLIALLFFFSLLSRPWSTTEIVVSLLFISVLDVGLFVVLNAFKLGYSGQGVEGSDFAVQNSLHEFSAFTVAAITLYFAKTVGFSNIIIAAISITLLAGILLYVINPVYKKREQLEL